MSESSSSQRRTRLKKRTTLHTTIRSSWLVLVATSTALATGCLHLPDEASGAAAGQSGASTGASAGLSAGQANGTAGAGGTPAGSAGAPGDSEAAADGGGPSSDGGEENAAEAGAPSEPSTGGRLNSGGSGASGAATGGGGGGAAPATGAKGWASWSMPNWPGQPNPYSYNEPGDGTVHDQITGLIWEKTPGLTTPGVYASASSYCAALSLGGSTDWRVPTRIEMISLFDASACPDGGACINRSVFTQSPTSIWYWTASIYASDASKNIITWSGEARTYVSSNGATPEIPSIVRCVH